MRHFGCFRIILSDFKIAFLFLLKADLVSTYTSWNRWLQSRIYLFLLLLSYMELIEKLWLNLLKAFHLFCFFPHILNNRSCPLFISSLGILDFPFFKFAYILKSQFLLSFKPDSLLLFWQDFFIFQLIFKLSIHLLF